MKRPHPASQLALGFAMLFAAVSREGTALFLAGAALTAGAAIVAPAHFRPLWRRSRWLLLTLLVLFGWMTPGTATPWLPGATDEGLWLAAEHLTRLVVALAVVALLLRALSITELVAGVRTLLAPLELFRLPRDRFAVRLALTLKEVEAARGGDARESPDVMRFDTATAGAVDGFLVVAAVALLAAGWLA